MTNKQRKTMIEQWVTKINPKAFFVQPMPDVGQGTPSMLYLLQESSEQDALTTCHWSSWSSTFWAYSMPVGSISE